MKIAYAPYKLSREREGALIRIGEPGYYGYADLHPWIELGDLPLQEQLKRRDSFLWHRTLELAKVDQQARKEKRSLLANIKLPLSHHLIDLDNLPKPLSGETVKLKVGINPEKEIATILKFASIGSIKICLDFNFRLSRASFLDYLTKIPQAHSSIDFIEDPYPFDELEWAQDQKKLGLTFALDHNSERGIGKKEAAPVLILKPARQSEIPFLNTSQRVVVTSSIDHPVGQSAAAWVASFFPLEVAGLLTHSAFPENPYSREFREEGRKFIPAKGFGWGFDHLLEQEVWNA